MKSRARTIVWITLLVIACLPASAAGAAASAGRSAGRTASPASRLTVNIHTLQIAVQCYCVDHGDLWPPEASDREFRAMLRPYIDGGWPTNPYTGKPMREKRTAGNFTYATYAHRTSCRMIGWGRHGHRVIVVP